MSNNWPKVRLSEVLVERRETPDAEALALGDIRIVSKIRFNTGKIELRQEAGTKTGMILVRPGDLLLSGINAAKGAIAIYGADNTDSVAATIHYGAYSVVQGRADAIYLWWYLRSGPFREILFQSLPGGIKTELKASRLLPIEIPLPPLEEQQRIVALIEKLSAQVCELRELRLHSIQEASLLMRSYLHRLSETIATTGRLGEVLVAAPRNGWSVTCDNGEGGTSVLTLSAVTGYHYRGSEFKRTSLPVPADGHFWLRPGDLLITRSNTAELVGHAAIYDGAPFPCIYPDLMMRLETTDSLVDRRFVWYWLQSPIARDYIEQNAKGTSPTMKKISQRTVLNIPFPTSLSLAQQRQLVADLDVFQAKVKAIGVEQTKSVPEIGALLPAILDRAFKGEL